MNKCLQSLPPVCVLHGIEHATKRASLIYGFMTWDMKQCHGSSRWECQFQKLHSYMDIRMCGSCLDIPTSIQKMCLRNMQRSRIVQRYNDKCHRRWHKPPRVWWRVFVGSHELALWLVVLFWLNQERDNKGLMTLEKKTRRQLRQSKTWWTPYLWMGFHHQFLLSGFQYSLRCLYCIYRLRSDLTIDVVFIWSLPFHVRGRLLFC